MKYTIRMRRETCEISTVDVKADSVDQAKEKAWAAVDKGDICWRPDHGRSTIVSVTTTT